MDKQSADRIIVKSNARMEIVLDWFSKNREWLKQQEFHAPLPCIPANRRHTCMQIRRASVCRLPEATGTVVPMRVCSTWTSTLLVLARTATSAYAPLSMESWTLRFDICKAAVKPPYSKERLC